MKQSWIWLSERRVQLIETQTVTQCKCAVSSWLQSLLNNFRSRSSHGDVCMCPNNLYYNEQTEPRLLDPVEPMAAEHAPVSKAAEPMREQWAGSDEWQPQQPCTAAHFSPRTAARALEAKPAPAPRHLVTCLSSAQNMWNRTVFTSKGKITTL